MAAPERFAESQIPLEPPAPSIHSPSRPTREACSTVAIRGEADSNADIEKPAQITPIQKWRVHCSGPSPDTARLVWVLPRPYAAPHCLSVAGADRPQAVCNASGRVCRTVERTNDAGRQVVQASNSMRSEV